MENSYLQNDNIKQQNLPIYAKGLVSKLLTLLLSLAFFLPWFTFKACNMSYDYNGYNTIVFQPSNDIGQFTENISKLSNTLSNKSESKVNNIVDGNDFTIVSVVSIIITILLAIIILITYYLYNGKVITTLSSINSILFLIILAILLYDKSKIPPDTRGVVNLNIEYGLIISFIISIIMVFCEKIEYGLIISDTNSFLSKTNIFFRKKYFGLIGIGLIFLGLLLSFSYSGNTYNNSNKYSEKEDKLSPNNNRYEINYVVDETGTLTQDQINPLVKKLKDFENVNSTQLVVYMIQSLAGKSIEDAAYSITVANKIGKKGSGNSVMILIAKNDRMLRIEVSNGLVGVLTDDFTSQIRTKEMNPYFRNGKFYEGINSGVDAIISKIKQ